MGIAQKKPTAASVASSRQFSRNIHIAAIAPAIAATPKRTMGNPEDSGMAYSRESSDQRVRT